MVSNQRNGSYDELNPSAFRREVSSQNQFQLPELLVRELGFASDRYYPTNGAMVAWRYHEDHNKAVLTTDEVDRPSLEFVGVSSLSGVSNEALASGDETAAQVTIIKELPDDLHTLLTRDAVVLKPIYASRCPTLDATCVSVYPAAEYDEGTLPNVSREHKPLNDKESSSSDGKSNVGTFGGHANSI